VTDPWRQIDVLVFPSVWYENYPQVLQEAFASGTPVIASDIGALPELVHDGKNGRLFTPGDAIDLRDKMQSFIDCPDLIRIFGQNSQSVRSIQEEATALERIYQILIEKSTSSE
jgi:glycosyltransferase involved in cell wall biosynthesis